MKSANVASFKSTLRTAAKGRIAPSALVVLALSLVGVAHASPFQGAASSRRLMAEVLSRCPGSAGLDFVGSGSDKAEEALVLQEQEIAPMSRDLAPALTCQSSNPGEAEGLLLGLDAVTIAAAQTSLGSCVEGIMGGASFGVQELNGVAGSQCPGCVAGEYELEDWRDVLRLVFLGMPHGAGADLSKRDCNSDVRHTLAKKWDALFGPNCASGTCARLEHAFRPADRSEKTALFLNLIGVTSPGVVNAFCNGAGAPAVPLNPGAKDALTDFLDNDPIRRPCDPKDQVCGADHTLGLVLPIVVPDNSPPEVVYPKQPCTFGMCRFLLTNQLVLTCPNGKPQLFGKCFQQVADLGNDKFSAACIPHPGMTCFGGGNQDGRAYNKAVMNPNGTYALDSAGRANTGAFYRLHTTTARGAASTCQKTNDLSQIACLTQSTGCSLGSAGLDSASALANVSALRIDGVAASLENVRKKAVTDKEAGAYPLAARVLFNSMRGFDALTSIPEGNLAGCLNSPTLLQASLAAAELIPLESAPKCVDFDERVCGTTLFNRNACNKRIYNWCPSVTGLYAAPTTTSVGGSINLAGAATDPDGSVDPIEYVWSAASGTFANRFARTTKFTCTQIGPVEITLAVWDGACKTETSIPANCVARSP